VWPPPAPPEYIDRAQLPANLRPSLVATQRHHETEDDNTDDVSDVVEPAGAGGSQLMRQRSTASESGPLSTPRAGTGHTDTSQHDYQRDKVHVSGDTDTRVKRQSSDGSHEREPGHQLLKRTSSDDREPDVQAKRLPDGVGHSGPRAPASTVSSHSMVGDAADESRTRPRHVHDSETPRSPAQEMMEPRDGGEPRGGGDTHSEPMPTVPPRLMDQGFSDEPMVIEFSAAAGGAGSANDDETSVRAGHKRARVNSDTVHNDVIRHSFVKRPITFYGTFALHFAYLVRFSRWWTF